MTDKTTTDELREAIVAVARISSNNAQTQAARMLGFEIQVAIVEQLAELGGAVARIAISLESLERMTRDDVDSYRGDGGFDTTVPASDDDDAEPAPVDQAAALAAQLDQSADVTEAESAYYAELGGAVARAAVSLEAEADYYAETVRVSARKSERQANVAYDDDGLTTDAFTALKNKNKKGQA